MLVKHISNEPLEIKEKPFFECVAQEIKDKKHAYVFYVENLAMLETLANYLYEEHAVFLESEKFGISKIRYGQTVEYIKIYRGLYNEYFKKFDSDNEIYVDGVLFEKV